ncbi:putative ATPase [Archaeoglobus fulgidus DSM 8774]|uniref:Putative ATPase n=1 Tax=Archaeoglobus fulgidus DSM 8774 TaxID=1344584 RepID=A0A075WF63_ARCFL|nr:ATP-binding protein [Archaeoglobus fulgidus]AIG98437.1 putative ATPase [Archaeoglobus fulgidus DSM 8774]
MPRRWACTLDLFQEGVINVIELSHLDPHRFGLRQFILSIICKKLFYERVRARRLEEFGRITNVPRIWLLIDEAHQFIPSGRTTASKPILIRWVKEGRQPGLSIVLATQQPSAIDNEILSQCNIVISHRVTNKLDLNALNVLSHDYMKLEFREYMKKIKNPGEAIFLDDEAENIRLVGVRKRMSRHGGREVIMGL